MSEFSKSAMQIAQRSWADTAVRDRLQILRRARRHIARTADAFANAVALPGRRTAIDTLPMEVMPLLAAIRFLERDATALLKPRRLGRQGRPFWLSGIESEVHCDPYGIVLVIAPFNYPLFLPGVQAVQALAAGNAVLVKPSPGHSAPMRLLRDALAEAGLPSGLMHILPEEAEAGRKAIAEGVDKIVLTGSAATGRAVLRQAADTLTPVVAELSGSDPVFVLSGAKPAQVARSLAYGLGLNGGATCIAPRCAYGPTEEMAAIEAELAGLLLSGVSYPIGLDTAVRVRSMLAAAEASGARVTGGTIDGDSMTPAIVVPPTPALALAHEDIFAPVLSLVTVRTEAEAKELAALSPYALGASVFGPSADARAFAASLDTGTVVINDVIMPTADPRVPFEGRRESGFGPTRGAEGLLAMTHCKTVLYRRRWTDRHMRPLSRRHRALFLGYIRLANRFK